MNKFLLRNQKLSLGNWFTVFVFGIVFSTFQIGTLNAQTVSIVTPPGTLGNTNGTGADPVCRYYNSIRFQVVYTVAELQAAGLVANAQITKLAWNVTEASGSLGNYQVRMGHTAAANSAAHDSSPLTVVKNPFTYATATGYNDITFDVPFTWNGTGNLLVEICTGAANPFSSPWGGVAAVTGVTSGSRGYRVDGTSACGSTTTSTYTTKPVVRLSWLVPVTASIVTPVGTLGNSNGTTGDPVCRYYNSIRYQVVYTAAELIAAGLTANAEISKFAWNVTEASGTLGNYTIRMGHTTAANSASHDNTPTTQVKNPFSYTTALGYNDITLDVPFVWNGTSNLLIEICTGPSNPFTSPWGGVAVSTGITNGSRFFRTDGSSACGVSTSSTNSHKPLCRLTWAPSSGCTGTPAPGNTVASSNSVFAGNAVTLSLQNPPLGAGITYQWQTAPSATGPWTNVTGGTAAGLSNTPTATTWYRCQVTCSGNTGNSTPVQVQLNPYCQPLYSSGTLYGDLISNVAISGPGLTWNNNSGTATTGPSYVPYTNLPPVVMQAATSYSMTVTAGSFSGQAFAVWIDANDDNVFSASEKVGFSTGTTSTSFGSVTFNINLPCTPPLGIHRMRVRGVWLGNGATMDPCISYGYGEAEDYLVQYVAGAPFTPSFTAAAPAQACTYIDYSYTTQSGMQNYAWTLPGVAGVDYTLVSGGTATANSTVVKWLTPGAKVVSVNYNNASGCASAGPGSNTVTVQQTALVPNTAGANTVCAGATVNFTNTMTGGAWTSLNPAVATVNATTGVITGLAVGTTDIVYSIANPNTWCAASTNTKAISVLQTPIVNAGVDATICSGGSTLLNGSSSFVQTHTIQLTDTWGDGWNGCSANVLVNGTAVLSNITLASGFGPATFTFGAATGATITVTFNNTGFYPEETRIAVLNGAGTTLVSNYAIGLAGPWTGTAGPAISSTWSPALSLSNAAINNPLATPSATTTYTMSTTAANGCTGTDQVLITVLSTPSPTPIIAPNGNTTFCAGGSVMLVAPPADSYVWSNGATSQTIPVTTAGNYFVTVNVGICTGTSPILPVTVNALPSATITSSATALCPGASATLTVPAASTYNWSTGAQTAAINVSNAGTYSVTVTNANGCSATSAPVTITASGLPSVSVAANGPVTFCQGSSVGIASSATGASSYLWSNGATTPSITATNSGIYFVTVTNAAGCQAVSNEIVVNAQQTFTATATALSPTTVCAGTPVTLVASPGSSYLWSNGATTQGVNVTAGGAITVTVTNASGCTGTSAPISVTVLPVPNATINAGGSLTFCQGGSVNLTATGGTSYNWSTGANTAALSANTSGTYVVTVTAANGCTDSEQATVTVNSVPSANVVMDGNSVLCPGESLTLSAAPGNTYAWTTGASTSEITVSTAGTYGVTVTSANGCSANSGNIILSAGNTSSSTLNVTALDTYTLNGVEYTTAGTYTQVIQNEVGCDSTITLNLTLTVGIDELSGVAYEVYPNPTADQFTIDASQAVYGAYSIQDAQGKVVKDGMMNGLSTTVELNQVARGIYFLRIAERSEAIRIIKN
jgi:hypothetical protein